MERRSYTKVQILENSSKITPCKILIDKKIIFALQTASAKTFVFSMSFFKILSDEMCLKKYNIAQNGTLS